MKKLFFSLIVIFIIQNLSAQKNALMTGANIQTEYDFLNMAHKMQTKQKPGNKINSEMYSNTLGNPYWHNKICKAKVVQNNDVAVRNVPMKMDQYIGEIIAEADNGVILYLETRLYKEILVYDGENLETFRKFNPNHPHRFYKLLYENEQVVVFKDIEVKLNKSETSNLFLDGNQQEFQRRQVYYMNTSSGIKELSFKKKKFFKNFSKKEERTMSSYAKKKKLKLKDEQDYIAMIRHLYQSEEQ